MASVLTESTDEIRALLLSVRTIAIVGLSSSRMRASHDVATYLQAMGYRIIPINPHETEVLGEKSYAKLADVPADIQIDLVDLFRRSAEVGAHVDEAIARPGVRCVWMQDGVIDWDAARRAHAAGLKVVMDDCTLRRHRQLIGRPRA